MQIPNVENVLVVEAEQVTYRIMAYRTLTTTERIQAVGAFKAARKRKPKPGSMVTIVSVLR